MGEKKIDDRVRKFILEMQRNEITEYYIYKNMAEKIGKKGMENRKVLERIAEEELRHYNIWKGYTGVDVKPDKWRIRRYTLIRSIFGITFAMKKLENGEAGAQKMYREIAEAVPEVNSIIEDEVSHENYLITLIEEERLDYISSMVLGLNDALVELTGALAGFTWAFNNSAIIAMTALITGIAAALSMGASEYLSTKSEIGSTKKTPIKAAIYTGLMYIFTVLVLITPYLMLTNVYLCLGISLVSGVLLIVIFTYYQSVVKNFSFRRRFIEMAAISLGIAVISFFIGYFVRIAFNVEI